MERNDGMNGGVMCRRLTSLLMVAALVVCGMVGAPLVKSAAKGMSLYVKTTKYTREDGWTSKEKRKQTIRIKKMTAGYKVAWKSSNKKIATVKPLKKAGKAALTVSLGKKGKVKITAVVKDKKTKKKVKTLTKTITVVDGEKPADSPSADQPPENRPPENQPSGSSSPGSSDWPGQVTPPPIDIPYNSPTPPAATRRPPSTPSPTPTPIPKDAGDVKLLEDVIKYQRENGANVSMNLDNEERYLWDGETGRLIGLNWSDRSIRAILDLSDFSALVKVDVSGCTQLEELHCQESQLRELSVRGCSELTTLTCGDNQLESLEVGGCPLLTTLRCNDNQLESLDLAGLGSLTTLACHNNELVSLSVSKLTKLVELSCYNNHIKTLNIGGLSLLASLNCGQNELDGLDATGLDELEELVCDDNQLTSLNVIELHNLKRLACKNNLLTEVDLTGCIRATDLSYDAGVTIIRRNVE